MPTRTPCRVRPIAHPRSGPARLRSLRPWILVAGLGAAGCADRATPDFRGRPVEPAPIVVDVTNQHYADVNVYVTRDGSWVRIGSVTGNATAVLEIPETLSGAVGTYRFRVHAIGSSDATDYVSDGIVADRGDVIALVVAPVLSMSSWSIRR